MALPLESEGQGRWPFQGLRVLEARFEIATLSLRVSLAVTSGS